MTESFVNHGFWFADALAAQERIEQIQQGDCMAIKQMLGKGVTEMAIRAFGVVNEVAHYKALGFKIIYVKWMRIEDRRVPFQDLVRLFMGRILKQKLKRSKEIFSGCN